MCNGAQSAKTRGSLPPRPSTLRHAASFAAATQKVQRAGGGARAKESGPRAVAPSARAVGQIAEMRASCLAVAVEQGQNLVESTLCGLVGGWLLRQDFDGWGAMHFAAACLHASGAIMHVQTYPVIESEA